MMIEGTVETIEVGPLPIFFCNTNTKMALKGHCHTAYVHVVYQTLGDFGYPAFQATNDALRRRLRELTGVERPFRDATNEDVLRQLFAAFDGWTAPEWLEWGGQFTLHEMRLDVVGVEDRIGHDPGVTRYSIRKVLGVNA